MFFGNDMALDRLKCKCRHAGSNGTDANKMCHVLHGEKTIIQNSLNARQKLRWSNTLHPKQDEKIFLSLTDVKFQQKNEPHYTKLQNSIILPNLAFRCKIARESENHKRQYFKRKKKSIKHASKSCSESLLL